MKQLCFYNLILFFHSGEKEKNSSQESLKDVEKVFQTGRFVLLIMLEIMSANLLISLM